MAKFCTCDVETINKIGFESREGKIVCKKCGLPDISSSAQIIEESRKEISNPVEGSFFASLFEMNLDTYISVKFSRFIYGLSVFVYGLLALISIIFVSLNANIIGGLTLPLIAGSVALCFVLIILSRLATELIVVIFQIARDIRTLAERI